MYGGSGTWPSASIAASTSGAPSLETHEPAAEELLLEHFGPQHDAGRPRLVLEKSAARPA